MHNRRITSRCTALAMFLMLLPGLLSAAGQTLVRHQNLAEMTAEAARIYRGTITDVVAGEVEINGSRLPTTTYKISVTDHFKGDVDLEKGDLKFAELRVVGNGKKYLRTHGDFAQFSLLPEPPRMQIGDDYLVFANAPNAHGLSNTIGLAQGYFHISLAGLSEICANELDNLGLFNNMGTGMPGKGGVEYDELASLIRAEIANGGGQP